MHRNRLTGFAWAFALFLAAAGGRAEECPACEDYEGQSLTTARVQLAEAFRLSLEVTDCRITKMADRCREIDKLLEGVLESMYAVFNGHLVQEVPECLTCDPEPRLWPLIDGTRAIIHLLQDKGDEGFTDARNAFLVNVDRWKRYRCPCSVAPGADDESERTVKRDREQEARGEIARKCGEKFANGKRGLLQVFRSPGDHPGCYQSRACRDATVHQGYQTQPGFWVYDGEYWYIWAERLGRTGEWITCER